MCVCVCACVCAPARERVCACVRACARACVQACTHAPLCLCATFTCVCVCLCLHGLLQEHACRERLLLPRLNIHGQLTHRSCNCRRCNAHATKYVHNSLFCHASKFLRSALPRCCAANLVLMRNARRRLALGTGTARPAPVVLVRRGGVQ